MNWSNPIGDNGGVDFGEGPATIHDGVVDGSDARQRQQILQKQIEMQRLQQQQQQQQQLQLHQGQQQQQVPNGGSSGTPQGQSAAGASPYVQQQSANFSKLAQQHPLLAQLIPTLTPENFATLSPENQAVLKEFITRQRQLAQRHQAQQQAQQVQQQAQQQQQQQQQQQSNPQPSPHPVSQPAAPTPTTTTAMSIPWYDPAILQKILLQQQQLQQQQPGNNGQMPPASMMFLKALSEFHSKNGTPMTSIPTVESKPVDLMKMYLVVMQGGGFHKLSQASWMRVAQILGLLPQQVSSNEMRVGALVSQLYQSVLLPFEQAYVQNRLQREGSQQPGQSVPTPSVDGASQNSADVKPPGTGTPLGAQLQLPKSSPQPTAAPSQTPQRELSPPPVIVPPVYSNPFTVQDSKKATVDEKPFSKIEYIPFTHTTEYVNTWDLSIVEDVFTAVNQRKRQKTIHDLGHVDMHSIIMSLKSRMASEVTYALNALSLITMHQKGSYGESQGLHFPLVACKGLLSELLELLQDAAFGEIDDEEEEEEQQTKNKSEKNAKGKEETRSYTIQENYPAYFKQACEDELSLNANRDQEREVLKELSEKGQCPLGRVELILSILNILRSFSLADDNARLMCREPGFVTTLVRISRLPLKRPSLLMPEDDHLDTATVWPTHVTVADSLMIKKDALQIACSMVGDIRLGEFPRETVSGILDLALFFIDGCELNDQMYFDLSFSPLVHSKFFTPPGVMSKVSYYVDLALSLFSKISLLDENRTILSSLFSESKVDLLELLENLIRMLPTTEADFAMLTTEMGVFFIANLGTVIYNLIFIAPTEVKLSIRSQPKLIKPILRFIRRMHGKEDRPDEALYIPICEWFISTLSLISEVGGFTKSSISAQAPWFGLGMNGDDEVDEVSEKKTISQSSYKLNPTESDRGTVKAKEPPSVSYNVGPPILAGESKVLFETYSIGSNTLLSKLSKLIEAPKTQ